MIRVRTGSLGLTLCVWILALHTSAAGVMAQRAAARAATIPQVKSLPAPLPSSPLKEDGPMQPVRSMAEALDRAMTKTCTKCKGKGKVVVGMKGDDVREPILKDCQACDTTGKVPNDPDKVQRAALSVVATIVRMKPDTQGADIALTKAYDVITERVIKNARYYAAVQTGSAGVLSQTKPVIGTMVMAKGFFGYELEHPNKPDQKVYVFRIAHKKQLVAVVAPKQSDTPQSGGRTLIGGVVAGAVNAPTDDGSETVIVVERGFMLAPAVDVRWWNEE